MCLRVVIILVNFEILGEMPIGGASDSPVQTAPLQQAQQPAQQYQSKPVQNNENVEPNKPQAKSFYNKESQPAAHKPTPLAASNQTSNQMFNNLKIFGISSLNPYQNK